MELTRNHTGENIGSDGISYNISDMKMVESKNNSSDCECECENKQLKMKRGKTGFNFII